MTQQTTLGRLSRDGSVDTVHLERHYDASPEEIWAILVEPPHVRNWLAEMTIEPRGGGRVAFDWGGDDQDEGVIRVFEPPRLLEYTWTRSGESVIRFELRPDGEGTLLTLDHRCTSLEQAIGVGAGWHSHLDAIEALVAGSPTTREIWTARYRELRPAYADQAEELG